MTELYASVEERLNDLHTRYLQSDERRMVLGTGLAIALACVGLIAIVNWFFDISATYPSLFLLIGIGGLCLAACIAVIQTHAENRFCRAEVLRILLDLERSGFKLYRSTSGRIIVSEKPQHDQHHLFPFTASQWNDSNLWTLQFWNGK